MRKRLTLSTYVKLLFAMLLALVVASCGSAANDANSDPTSDSASSGDSAQEPSRIISLSPSATETLWAVGAGDQVVAVDDQSNYPAGVPTTDLSGYTPNVEAILGYTPDLVIAMDAPKDLASGLEAAGVELLTMAAPATIDDAYTQIEQIGAATGHIGEAAELVGNMQTEIAAALESAPEAESALTYFHELDDTLFTVTGATFIGQVYGMFGLENIADAVGEDNPYPQLQSEFVVAADPSLIFLADAQCCGVTSEKVAERAGWADIAAVKEGRVYELDEDIFSRWGPRIVDMVQYVSQFLTDSIAAQPVR